VQPQGVGPIGGPGGENAGEGGGRVIPRVDPEEVAATVMQPGYENDLLGGAQAQESIHKGLADFDPGVGSTLRTLLGRGRSGLQGRADVGDGVKAEFGVGHVIRKGVWPSDGCRRRLIFHQPAKSWSRWPPGRSSCVLQCRFRLGGLEWS
jgi:hypothetical protein